MYRRQKPKRVGDLVEGVLKGLKLTKELKRHEVLFHWNSIVGEQIAKRARPLRIHGDTLMVEVDHPAWVQELNLLKEPFLAKIRGQHPDSKIRKLRFTLKNTG